METTVNQEAAMNRALYLLLTFSLFLAACLSPSGSATPAPPTERATAITPPTEPPTETLPTGATPAPMATASPLTEWIQLAADGQSFELTPSGQRFTAWGFNYSRGDRLLEDYWETEWADIAQDFGEMKSLGANVVRIHLQFAKFMQDPATPDEAALDRLEQMAALAEETGLYLDVTGLGAYRAEDTPEWYFTLSEEERWAAHARFWEAVTARLADSPAVFCYDLMNEPAAPAGLRQPEELLNGEFGGFHFLQLISLDQAGRPLEEIARQWIRRMTDAIRRHDARHLITVGSLPPSPELGYFSGFKPGEVAAELDFLSVHLYPEKSKIPEAVAIVEEFAAAGKPVVIEETSQLYSGVEAFEDFFSQSKGLASGWLGFYFGESPEEMNPPADMREAIRLEWLKLFQELGGQLND
jgi:hypothetical protein